MVFSFGVTERGLSILPECKNLFVGAPDECLKGHHESYKTKDFYSSLTKNSKRYM